MKQTFVNLFSKKGIFCLFFCMSIGQLSAQGGYLPTVKTPASPVAASFNVYGEIPVSKYTGIPDISIPLYTIDLGGLQIPISLSYHPAGVRVEAEASWVGLGWTLTAGGTISREIKGLDDFKIGGHWWRFNEPGITEDYKKPIPWDRINCDIWLTNELCPCYFNMDTRFDVLPCGRDHLRVSKRTLRIDCEPDLFSYNFLGYSGRFVIKEGENTAILEKPEDGLDIKIFKVGNLYYIDVTLPTGDICHFYQFEESTPYSGESIESSNSVGQTSITSWCLSSIEFLNGDFISYEYISKNNVERNTYLTYIWQSDRIGDAPTSPLLNRDISNAEVPNQECGGLSILPEYTSYSKSWFSNGSLANTELYLKKISWNGNIINFTHSLRSDYGRNYFSQNQPVCMSGLEVRNQKNKLVKGYSFNYSYFDIEGSNKASYLKKRLRLDSFYEYSSARNLPSYRFTYDTRYELPLKNSLSFDVWGYYNGTYASSPGTDLLPEIVSSGNTRYFNWEYPGRTGTLINNGRNMRCSPIYITTGMLTKIVYPTGGYAEFTFEPNTYMNSGQEKKGGGVRIAKIKTDATERLFDYNDGNKSSGLLLVEPVFSYIFGTSGISRVVYSSRSLVQLQGNTFGNFVGYKKVTETVICNGKKSRIVENYYSDNELEFMKLYTKDVHGMNGMLLSRYLFSDTAIVQKVEYEYHDFPNENLRPNQRAMKYDDGIIHFYNVFPECHKRLSSELTINFLGNGHSENRYISYSYNSNNYAVNRISMNGSSDTKSLITQTIYSSDLDKGIFPELKECHVLNKPVEVTQYINKNGVERVIGSQLTLYNDRAQPTKVYKLETDTPLNGFMPFTSTTGDNKDSRYSDIPELELLYYDANVILPEESITRDGLHEFYIWGHSNSCILAKIENATKAQIKQYIPNYDRLYEGEPTDEFYQQINNLRTQLPQARVTTYIYDSLIGLKQSINPDGTSIYYEYDSFNRLKCIKDNAGKVIEQYEYGYKQ